MNRDKYKETFYCTTSQSLRCPTKMENSHSSSLGGEVWEKGQNEVNLPRIVKAFWTKMFVAIAVAVMGPLLLQAVIGCYFNVFLPAFLLAEPSIAWKQAIVFCVLFILLPLIAYFGTMILMGEYDSQLYPLKDKTSSSPSYDNRSFFCTFCCSLFMDMRAGWDSDMIPYDLLNILGRSILYKNAIKTVRIVVTIAIAFAVTYALFITLNPLVLLSVWAPGVVALRLLDITAIAFEKVCIAITERPCCSKSSEENETVRTWISTWISCWRQDPSAAVFMLLVHIANIVGLYLLTKTSIVLGCISIALYPTAVAILPWMVRSSSIYRCNAVIACLPILAGLFYAMVAEHSLIMFVVIGVGIPVGFYCFLGSYVELFNEYFERRSPFKWLFRSTFFLPLFLMLIAAVFAASIPSAELPGSFHPTRGVDYSKLPAIPPYTICGYRFGAKTITDFAVFAKLAYSSPSDVNRDVQTWLNINENVWSVDVNASLGSPVSFYVFTRANEAVVAVRGTTIGFDWIQNAEVWSMATFFQLAKSFVPGLASLPSDLTATMLKALSFPLKIMQNTAVQTSYYAVIEDKIRILSRSYDSVVITGHSLGGGMAQIIAARLGITAVSFSAPGMMFAAGYLQLDVGTLATASTNIVPYNDLVPQIDIQAGLVQYIGCSSGSVFSCHSMTRTFCALMRSCRDPFGRWIDDAASDGCPSVQR